MLSELNGKGGCLCEPARKGELRCPLIIRPTSEDVVTGQLFGSLKALNPRWWLPDLLNRALGTQRFRRQVFRKLDIQVWQKQRTYPRHRLPWDEGQTEVDVVLTWENPPTTVFIEMKYGSAISSATVHNDGTAGFPSDQLIRNARVGLWENGWFSEELLFDLPPRDFVLILLAPSSGSPLVQEYRDPDRLRQAIPHGQRLTKLPRTPFIGELSYKDAIGILATQRRWFTRPEKIVVDQVSDYLRFKLTQLRTVNGQG
jgi:hypothetical protein